VFPARRRGRRSGRFCGGATSLNPWRATSPLQSMYRPTPQILERLEGNGTAREAPIPGTEPRNGANISSPEATYRLVSLVIGQGLSVSEALRQLAAGADGGEPETIGRTQADRILREERERTAARADVSQVAARILALLSAELGTIERATGPKDLDRVHRIAQTLGTVERLRPETGKAEEASLLSLREEDPTTPDPSV
jgi:hypothetical protein